MADENENSLINIEVEGLEPDLEGVLWRIVERLQIRASEEGFNALFGSTEQSSTPKENIKSEEKAIELIKEFIGDKQLKIYKKTKRVITKPSKWFWIIGDVFESRFDSDPFIGKPDVVRIDDEKKLYYTNFCVDQLGGERTPYTDKVISFATNLTLNEKKFKKTINRISEGTFDKMKECALWKF